MKLKINIKRLCGGSLIIALFILIASNAFAAVIINELLPDPTNGPDSDYEFIEIYNNGAESANINNWRVEDASGKKSPLKLTADKILQPGEYFVFWSSQTYISLNNSGAETVSLLDASSSVVDSISYQNAIAGKSYSKTENGWVWTDPTPGAANKTGSQQPTANQAQVTQNPPQSSPSSSITTSLTQINSTSSTSSQLQNISTTSLVVTKKPSQPSSNKSSTKNPTPQTANIVQPLDQIKANSPQQKSSKTNLILILAISFLAGSIAIFLKRFLNKRKVELKEIAGEEEIDV